jgi:Icc-related predicted phosphoesterase
VLRIAILGDIHGAQERLTKILGLLSEARSEMVLLVGDIGFDPPWHSPARETDRGRHDESVRWVLARVRSALKCPAVFVPGNHDLPDPGHDVEGLNVDRRVVQVAGLRVAGFGGAGPNRFGFPYEWDESEAQAALERLLSALDCRLDVLLCHGAPRNSELDRTLDGRHVGSDAVRSWISKARPRLFVCGHIHEAWGVEWLDDVPCVNAGALGDPYGQEIAWVVEWDAGPTRIESVRRRNDGSIDRRIWRT